MTKKKDSLITDLIMVQLHIEYDTGYRASKEMKDLIHETKKADKAALKAGVVVLSKNLTREFTAAVSQLRQFYLDESLPWEKKNWRVVPVIAWQEFKDKLEELIREANDAFETVYVKGYQKLKDEFKTQVGDLEVNFPTLDELKERFLIEHKMGQAASPTDIRIQGIDTIERKKISDSMQKQYADQINDGLTDLASRLVAAATDIGSRVQDEDQKSKKYTRTIKNLKDLADTAEKLNITGNDKIREACETIREDIAQWSPEAVKTTPLVRDHIADAAGSVQDKLAGLTM